MAGRGLGVCLPAGWVLAAAGSRWPEELGAALAGAGVDAVWLAEPADEAAGPDPVTVAGALAATGCPVGVLADVGSGRAPSLLAKEVTALDVLSDAHAGLGLGWGPWDDPAALPAAGDPAEHRRWVVEAATVCRGMWTAPAFTYTGQHVQVTEAVNHPPPLRPGGPRLLLRLPGRTGALRHAANLGASLVVSGPPSQLRRTAATSSARPPLVRWLPWPPGTPAAVLADDVQSCCGLVDDVVVVLPPPAAVGGPGGGAQALQKVLGLVAGLGGALG